MQGFNTKIRKSNMHRYMQLTRFILLVSYIVVIGATNIGEIVLFNQHLVYSLCIFVFLVIFFKNVYMYENKVEYITSTQLLALCTLSNILSKVNKKVSKTNLLLIIHLLKWTIVYTKKIFQCLNIKKIRNLSLFIGLSDLFVRIKDTKDIIFKKINE